MTELEQKVQDCQNQILNLLNQIGYGTACNPFTSGEIHAVKHAFRNKSNGILLDVGSYHGEFVRMANSLFPEINCHCFDPDPEAFNNLIEKTKDISHRIIYNNCALFINDGQETLYNAGNNSGLSSLIKRDLKSYNLDFSKEQTVKTIKLSSYLQEKGIVHVDYLKLDIEGMELFVLKDSIDLINRGMIKNIQFEFGGCNLDSRTFIKDFYDLLSSIYNIYRIHPEGLIQLNVYSELFEVYQPVNYYCELKV